MAAYMRLHYTPGEFQRAGTPRRTGWFAASSRCATTYRPEWRRGVFAERGPSAPWVRFAGPGPASPPDIEEVGVLSIGAKLMGVPGSKLLDDERFTQDFMGISAPDLHHARTSGRTRSCRPASLKGTPLFYFIQPVRLASPGRDHAGRLWARTQTSPFETAYWGCAPYLLGEGRAMQYSFRPALADPEPRAPPAAAPPDHYLRETMAATLARGRTSSSTFSVQLQTDAHRMPHRERVECAGPNGCRARCRSRPCGCRASGSTRRRASSRFAHNLSINPWHCVPEHRPLGNQNRARQQTCYGELSGSGNP